jgi:Icc-related predicted phosphoesterase
MRCFFVSDLHGKPDRYKALFEAMRKERPDGVFIGGDILPGGYGMSSDPKEFLDRLALQLSEFKDTRKFIILGNDDPKVHEARLMEMESDGIIDYAHGKCVEFGDLDVIGYSFVPPSPFMLKDWEKYDVSRFVGVGCVSPEEGLRSIEVPQNLVRYSTIDEDLKHLATLSDPQRTIYLFHGPPHETCLDRVDGDGKFTDHAPHDIHVGSIAIRRFIERTRPYLTLHGHIHESARLTGSWRERIGDTWSFGAAHDGPGLALVRFDTDKLEAAERCVVTLP